MKCQAVDNKGKRAIFELNRTSEVSLQILLPDHRVFYLSAEQVGMVLVNGMQPAVRYCSCEDMAKALTDETIVKWSDGTLAVRCVPNMVDDGDDHWDDMSGDIPIKVCPWCGKAIAPVKEEVTNDPN